MVMGTVGALLCSSGKVRLDHLRIVSAAHHISNFSKPADANSPTLQQQSLGCTSTLRQQERDVSELQRLLQTYP